MSPLAVDRLTALDQAFLQMERPGLPMHVASVGTFDAGPLLDEHGRLRVDDVVAHLEARAGLLPRLRQRVWEPPGEIDHACWVDDEDFDMRRHVDVVAVPPPGDERALREVAASTFAELLDRAHPLWHLRFVTGLEGDRVALIQRTHHAMVDGISGVDVAAVVLELSPDGTPVDLPVRPPVTAPTVAEEVEELLARAARAPAAALATVGHALTHPAEALRRGRALADALATVLGDGLTAPPCSLNVPVGDRRELVWVRTSLPALKAAGREHGATANDVLLAAIAGGLRAQLVDRGEVIPADCALKLLVPVSLRTQDERGALGNRVAAYLPALPVGIGDPVARLQATAATMRRLKGHREDQVSDVLLRLADALPVGLSAAIARTVDHQRFVNVVVTNVPGPPVPLYLLGARMLEAFPIVPLGGNLSEEVAILSYEDAVTIGITIDPDACPDVDVFVDGLERSLRELGVA